MSSRVSRDATATRLFADAPAFADGDVEGGEKWSQRLPLPVQPS